MKIVVVGIGYVGLANAILLAQKNDVYAVDINNDLVDCVNRRQSPIVDDGIEDFFANRKLNLTATTDASNAYADAEYIIVATPTNYDPSTEKFDTSSVESVLADAIRINPRAIIVIRSTIPIGFVDTMKTKFNTGNIIFAPEFLREGHALYDNLHPSRVVVGEKSSRANAFAQLLIDCSKEEDVPILLMDTREAEAVKLFANTYLATRVSFFNELDNFAMTHELNSRDIIEGICHDPRIGMHYNNPSFGYGGYCLPKDSKQLLANFKDVPQNLIQAVVSSNKTRKEFLTTQILKKKPNIVGIFRLIMKSGSDNYRHSAILSIMQRLQEQGVTLIIYEPTLNATVFSGARVYEELAEFKVDSDVIIANRFSHELDEVADKVFTRDIFQII